MIHHLSDLTRALDLNHYGIVHNGMYVNHAEFIDSIYMYASYLYSYGIEVPQEWDTFFREFLPDDLPEEELSQVLETLSCETEQALKPVPAILTSFQEYDEIVSQACLQSGEAVPASFSLLYVTMLDTIGACLVQLAHEEMGSMAEAHRSYIHSLQTLIHNPDLMCQETSESSCSMMLN